MQLHKRNFPKIIDVLILEIHRIQQSDQALVKARRSVDLENFQKHDRSWCKSSAGRMTNDRSWPLWVANVESSSDATSRKNVGLIVGVAVAILLMVVVVALLFWVYKIRNAERHSNRAISNAASNLGHCIPLAAVLESTNNFDKSLVVGIGGFGRLYKGTLSDGIIVAVKKGTPTSQQG
ncbi:hypothetical protein LguiB_001559 [Lonicera macranthoides]